MVKVDVGLIVAPTGEEQVSDYGCLLVSGWRRRDVGDFNIDAVSIPKFNENLTSPIPSENLTDCAGLMC